MFIASEYGLDVTSSDAWSKEGYWNRDFLRKSIQKNQDFLKI
jgi:hypothetical protein